MVIEDFGVAQQREKDWYQAAESLLSWFSEFFPVLQKQAGRLEVSQQALAELALAREFFVGSFCPCHWFYDPAAKPDIPALLGRFEGLARRMVEQIDCHPAMTDDLRQRMEIGDYYTEMIRRKESDDGNR